MASPGEGYSLDLAYKMIVFLIDLDGLLSNARSGVTPDASRWYLDLTEAAINCNPHHADHAEASIMMLLPFLCLLLAWTKGFFAMDVDMPFMVYLDKDNLVSLRWGFDDLKEIIKFQLSVNTTGWVGFGFSPNGGMKGADIVIGGLGSDGSYFKDRHATKTAMPDVDVKQDYILLSIKETEGKTVMTFERTFQTCDDKDLPITDKPIKLIYAYGETDDIKYHRHSRGTKEVNLLKYMPWTSPTSPSYLNATVDNITVPPKSTYYHCKVMKFPKLDKKHHIYQFEPVIENVDIVHHLLLYRCPSTIKVGYDKPCYMGDAGDACFAVVASWAVGGGVYELPENAGIPIGGKDSDTFYRLEIHYNTLEKKEATTDSSGLRLHYTSQLRLYDVGIMMTGILHRSDISYSIPPNANQFHSFGICNTSHFSEIVNPVPSIQVFGVLLHAHLTGRKVRVGHFRDGEQIDFLGLDENYDFELQQISNLGSIKTVESGDEIIVECTYNTTGRDEATMMGLSTMDEMCLALLFYYPEIGITTCVSHPNTSDLNITSEFFSTTEITDYETLLKNLPQIQEVYYNNNHFSYERGTVQDIMKTPTVCDTSSRIGPSWIVNFVGTALLLLWVAVM
ncbi:DBH-like monooxygenase protein 2 homolog [Pholidichthys leucotaenia]